jgi:hypothetical protein
VEWPEHENRYFVPIDRLKELITYGSILEEFERCKLKFPSNQAKKKTANRILSSCWRLFAILVYVGRAKFICDFLDEGLDDSDLPFERYQKNSDNGRFKLCSSKLRHKRPIHCMKEWDRLSVEALARDQWCMQAPVFEKAVDENGRFVVKHQNFDNSCVLPFIKDMEHQQAVTGGFSSVWEVKIHHAHQNLYKSTNQQVRRF